MKHPSILHLPHSPAMSRGDKRVEQYEYEGPIVALLKMDGENTCLSRDYIHARSANGYPYHPSRSFMLRVWATIHNAIPVGLSIFLENTYAKHSIHYDEANPLSAYFQVHSAWDGGTCLSWLDTMALAREVGLAVVDSLYYGEYKPSAITKAFNPLAPYHEGYVVRPRDSFSIGSYTQCVAKWVRPNFVQTSDHWSSQPIIRNTVMYEDPSLVEYQLSSVRQEGSVKCP